jgi:hypothetical protein
MTELAGFLERCKLRRARQEKRAAKPEFSIYLNFSQKS